MNTAIGRTLRYQARLRVQLQSSWTRSSLLSPKRKLSTAPSPSASVSPPQPPASSPSRTDKVIDFIENNGGKLFMFAVVVISGLIYRYYEGLQDRNRVEEQVERGSRLEPYEIQMLRLANGYDLDLYKQMIQAMVKQGLSWDSSISYDEVVRLVNDTIRHQNKSSSSTISTTLKLGHLIDRVVYGKALKGGDEPKVPVTHIPLSVAFTVGLLALPMESNVDNRLRGLFYASTSLTGRKEMTRSDLIEVIKSLVESDQIPPEKQIEETGEKYPIRRYRRRPPENMVKMYEEQILKATTAKESWNETDFVACVASRYVCAWGACYRGNNH